MTHKVKDFKNEVPIFYACDDTFVKFTIVSALSLIENADKNRNYVIYILNDGISENMKEEMLKLSSQNVMIRFVCVREQLKKLKVELPLRDYYSKTTYYRLFIAKMFPEYDKAVYIDSDTIVLGDVSEFFDTDIGDCLVGACNEQAMVQNDIFGNYAEKVVGVDRNKFFNAGHVLINCKAFRENNILEEFIKLLKVYTFVVTQDEDYLNVLCKNKVYYIEQGWNTEVYGKISVKDEDVKVLHYIMTSKPWHYEDCRYGEFFWRYAKKTSVYESVLSELTSYTDEQRERDYASCKRLEELAKAESLRVDTYANLTSGKAIDRIKIQEKIRRYEIEKKFDVDVEDDPKTIVLKPNKVDYLADKLITKVMARFANKKAVNFYEGLIKEGKLVIEGVNGIDNYASVKGGAIITCNHFSAFDNYVVYRAIRDKFEKGQRLYKVIREGNYTNFKGLYGLFFRYCNTLPLSSNVKTMKKFMEAVNVLLGRGEKILIYPEQAMWWNYRKPRPLKSGAFKIAVKNNVPIIPAFITLKDTDRLDVNGYPIQAHTLWFLPPVYPRAGLTDKENAEYMKEENFNAWKSTYEKVYGLPLKYGE